jgi:predicted ATPase
MSSNALDSITIQGFKSIASVEKLKLGPINVVIGPNGAGKSNFIGVFAFLHAIREGRLGEYVAIAGGAEKVLHFGSRATKEMHLCLRFQDETQYDLKLAPTADDGLFPKETVVLEDDTWPPQQAREGVNREGVNIDAQFRRVVSWIHVRLGGWRLYHMHDTSSLSPMRKTAKLHDNRFLRDDGSNLASFLYYLRERHASSYGMILRAVHRVAPFFDDFQLGPLRLNPDDIKLEWRHKNSDQYFDASSLSDGTLRFVALATLFLQPEEFRPSVILVDEPELGLHPYAIEMLASLIRQASVSTQVIVATQSSLLLDHFAPEDVLVANRVEGGTQLTRLKSEQLAAWLEDYSLGQLWEKNEFGGRPVPD